MSVVIETLILCDGDIDTCPLDNPAGDSDSRHEGAKYQRKALKQEGWLNIGKKDYCPVCAEKLLSVINYRY